MPHNVLNGTWTDRSYVNNSVLVGDAASKALALIFGEGQWRFAASDDRIFKAVLDFGGDAAMDLFGTIVPGGGVTPQVLLITGTGREGTATAKWV